MRRIGATLGGHLHNTPAGPPILRSKVVRENFELLQALHGVVEQRTAVEVVAVGGAVDIYQDSSTPGTVDRNRVAENVFDRELRGGRPRAWNNLYQTAEGAVEYRQALHLAHPHGGRYLASRGLHHHRF